MFRLMRKILALVPEMKGKFYLACFFKVMDAVFLGAPYGFLILILHDLLAETADMEKALLHTACMMGCFLFQGIFYYLFTRIAYPMGTELSRRVRVLVGEHLQKLPMRYFVEKETGDLNSLVSDELALVAMVPRMAFPQFVTAMVLPVALAPFLFYLDRRLALVTLCLVPVAVPLLSLCRNALNRGVRGRSASRIEVSSRIIEYVQGMDVVKSFRQTGERFEAFASALRGFRRNNLKMVAKALPFMMLFQAVLDLGFVLILLAGTWLFLAGGIPLFVLLLFLVLGLRIYEPIKALIVVYEIVQCAEVTMDRLEELLATEPLPEPEKEIPPVENHIRFENVDFSYGNRKVLDHVSFFLPEKSVTAVVGPSGAGKTTLTRLMARFWDVDQGMILLGGRDVRAMRTETLLSRISMVFQDVYLFHDTIFNNIAFGSEKAARTDVEAAAKAACCHEFIEKLPQGYDTMVGEGGMTLSGGEKQRISIARAILKDAPVILLDEATASVDAENEFLIQEALGRLVHSKTLFVIAHRLSTITSADQILVLDGKGRLEALGKHEELLQKPGTYRTLWESRMEAEGWELAVSDI